MRCTWILLLLTAVTGCLGGQGQFGASAPPVSIYFENPMLVTSNDPQFVWETMTNVIRDYFRLEREEPCRVVGATITEGRLDTFPDVGSTCLEPWRNDSADSYEKAESTLQSIRRRALVRVMPAQGGFWIDVAVYKELEDVAHAAHAASGSATFTNPASLSRVINAVGEQEINKGWIPMGRDRALEQRILAHLGHDFGSLAVLRSPAQATLPFAR